MDCVTAFCDASFRHDTKAAAWACWVKGPLGTFNKAYPFKTPPAHATEAEKYAAINTLAIIKKMYAGYKEVTIVLQVDCLDAKFMMEGKPTKGKPETRNLHEVARKHVATLPKGWTLKLKHVKAHNGTSDVRSYVNTLIDRQAFHLAKSLSKQTKKEKTA